MPVRCRLIHPPAPTLGLLVTASLGMAALCLLSACRKPEPETQKIPTVWYVDPATGSDSQSGRSAAMAWESFEPLRQRELKPGDELIVAPGQHRRSLVPKAIGSADAPVVIRFLPGIHEFGVEQATRKAFFISNAGSAPETPMPIGILIENCQHLQLLGGGTTGAAKTTLLMAGRMVHFINDHSDSIQYEHLVFDLKRPTVSEFRVTASGDTWSDIHIAEGSSHHFEHGVFEWTGDLGVGRVLTQEAIPTEGRAWRVGLKGNPLDHASRIEALGQDRFRLHFESRPPLKVGHQFQIRHLFRDVVGAHNNRSQNISIQDCEFNALAGMGIISQFTDGIRYERVRVVPPADTLRSCPAWADVFHFSGCRGQILVKDCRFSGTQDDPINVHGTHLRILGQPEENQLLVSFIHKQTYGFAAFEPGDEVAVIHTPTLREHPDNPRRKVTAIERRNDRDWLLTLDGPAPDFVPNDVIDNLTWHPDLTVQGCHVEMDSCRGFLVTTRGKVMIEDNTFRRCHMPAILIENDASGWFESGPVRDMTIRNNTFIGCGIRIHPRVSEGKLPVHDNIRITDNHFTEGAGIEARHTSGLVIRRNRSEDGALPLDLDPASTRAMVDDHE